MENKDFYVIELKTKVKIGITQDFEKRLSAIKTGAGIKDNEIVNVFHYPDLSFLENRAKSFFRKQKIAGEWFYKKGIVLDFINTINNNITPSVNLFNDLKNKQVKYNDVYKKDKQYYDFSIQKENAINLLEKIKSERTNIGYPDSIDLAKFIKTRKAGYRNMVYSSDSEFKYFERHPNFTIENIKDCQIIECLKILRNITPNNNLKKIFQDYIDSIFAKSKINFPKCLELIESFFFQKNRNIIDKILEEEIKYKNIKMTFSQEGGYYSLTNYFDTLNKDEKMFLKNTKNANLCISPFGFLDFDYKDKSCFCYFETKNYLRVLNFFSIQKIEKEKGIRLFFNDTNKSSCHYVFQFKYHLLNPFERNFIKHLYIENISSWYIEFTLEDLSCYCLYDDFNLISEELKININTYKKEEIEIIAEPFLLNPFLIHDLAKLTNGSLI